MRPSKPSEDDAPREFLRDFTPSEQRDLDEHEDIVLPYTTTKNLPVAWSYDFSERLAESFTDRSRRHP